MKNKEILKLTAGFALSLALLAPASNISYATNTGNSNAVAVTSKDKFEATLNKVYLRLKEFQDVINSPIYVNSTFAKRDAFRIYYNDLANNYETINKNHENGVYKTDADYDSANNTLAYRLNLANQKHDELDGKVVDKADLSELIDAEISFKQSAEYKTATQAQKEAYNTAIRNGKNALAKGAYLSKDDNTRVIDEIKSAVAAIIREYDRISLIAQLNDELLAAKEIVKNKAIYTTKSYEVFDAARIAATTTHENNSSTYDQVKSSLNALKSAKDSLEKLPTSEDEKKAKQIEDLRNAIKENDKMVAAANYLLKETPKTVESVKDKLLDLIKDAEAKTAKGRKALAKLEGIKG